LVDTEIRFFMQRRVFSREFKLEAVKLVTERGVLVVQAAATWTWRRVCCGVGSNGPPNLTSSGDKEIGRVWA